MTGFVKQVSFGNTGLKISPIIVGCMSYGSKNWAEWVEDDKNTIFGILKYCYDKGLRTFDTADYYSNGLSEKLLGEFLVKYNIKRETVVIMTKIFFPFDETLNLKSNTPLSELQELDVVNQRGLSRKHILDGVEKAIARLGTYIDVLQIHRFDPETPIKETMKALNDVIESGHVRYIGASSMLATQFAEMQFIADKYNWFQFVNAQSMYNLVYREDERELIPFCKRHNIALTPWSPNHRGFLTRPIGTKSLRSESDRFTINKLRDNVLESDIKIVKRVEELAEKKGVSMAAISTAWVVSKGCQPIIGLSKTERVDDAISALSVTFTDEELKYLEDPYKPKNYIL
ncbi:hypothetical protein KAFR_0C03670 [Kazachstania africana CBS 2517]|uniref:NADP-dependent oxidoreductase domain-containing protein n=1 Tax=Kazachstania africana (strain ATCC 22294 / BCRC 22015 / CBS 2517 / CECT 1963 / NBRC 1671 / NRRL Y-8276) TaxID=1071382 RepID=H2ASK9_KAZAF|nr:hypothetical protein KAFR_0C03670 [Kazachstania africana CBS 2517]CCF57359.1 hypothetical protein KAFR_0C03670 [Kazachstania africana CBS 2517]